MKTITSNDVQTHVINCSEMCYFQGSLESRCGLISEQRLAGQPLSLGSRLIFITQEWCLSEMLHCGCEPEVQPSDSGRAKMMLKQQTVSVVNRCEHRYYIENSTMERNRMF